MFKFLRLLIDLGQDEFWLELTPRGGGGALP